MGKIIAISLVFLFLMASCLIVTKPVSGASAAGNSWVQKAPMPWQYSGDEAAVANGIIYMIGVYFHYDASTKSTIITPTDYAYNSSTDTWTTIPPMPTPRLSFAIATFDNKIYVIGGFEITASNGLSQTGCSVNEVYDPSTNTWSTAASMLIATSEMQANMVNGKIYVMGGMTGGKPGSTVNITQIYDPTTDSWSEGASMPYSVTTAASAVVDNNIYVIGGNDEYLSSKQDPTKAYVHFTQIYNPISDTWSLGAPIPGTGFYLGAGATTGVMAPKRIYVFGGLNVESTNLSQFSNQTYAYDPATNSWTSGTHMPYACPAPAVAVVNDLFYVIGGKEGVSALGENSPSNLANQQYTPFGYGTPDPSYILANTPPKINVLSPLNQTYNESSVSLIFSVDKSVNWLGYSFDGKPNVTVTGNATLANMTNGLHNVTVYANDTFGNIGASETISFTVTKPEPFPTVTVATASVISAVVLVAGLLVYFKKRKR